MSTTTTPKIPTFEPPSRNPPTTPLSSFLGLLQSSVFSLSYLFAPVYLLSALPVALLYGRSHVFLVAAYVSPLLLSAAIPPIHSPGVVKRLTAMLTYFDYEEIHEISDAAMLAHFATGKSFVLAAQPHGVISFTGMCSAVYCVDEFRKIKTAVASVLMSVPILKHVLGIYGLVDASAGSLKRHFKKGGVHGSIVIYIGGIAELFKSSRKEERLYLNERKGFIKMALREGVDVIPIYLLGNTSVLTVLKSGPLASLSRKLQVTITYFWGRGGLPIPRPDKLIYIRGRPLGLRKLSVVCWG